MATDKKGARKTVLEYATGNLGSVDVSTAGAGVISAIGIVETFDSVFCNVLQKCRKVIAEKGSAAFGPASLVSRENFPPIWLIVTDAIHALPES
jgi:hypothetical protein